MREQATVYVIRKKGTRRYRKGYGGDGDLGRIAAAFTFHSRRDALQYRWIGEEVVPCRLVVLSARTKRSKRRTR